MRPVQHARHRLRARLAGARGTNATAHADARRDGRGTGWTIRSAHRVELPTTAALYERARSGASGDWYGDASITSRSPRSSDSLTANEGPDRRRLQPVETAALYSLLLFFKSA